MSRYFNKFDVYKHEKYYNKTQSLFSTHKINVLNENSSGDMFLDMCCSRGGGAAPLRPLSINIQNNNIKINENIPIPDPIPLEINIESNIIDQTHSPSDHSDQEEEHNQGDWKGHSPSYQDQLKKLLKKYKFGDKKQNNFIVTYEIHQSELTECSNYISIQDKSNIFKLPIHLKECKIPIVHHLLTAKDYLKTKNSEEYKTLEWIFVPINLDQSSSFDKQIGLFTINLIKQQVCFWSPSWSQFPHWVISLNHRLSDLQEKNNFIYNSILWQVRYSKTDDTQGDNNLFLDYWILLLTMFEHIKKTDELWLCQHNKKTNKYIAPLKHTFDWFSMNSNNDVEDHEEEEPQLGICQLTDENATELELSLSDLSSVNEQVIGIMQQTLF